MEDTSTPVIGYRIFVEEAGLLYSPFRRVHAWQPGENAARCDRLWGRGAYGVFTRRHRIGEVAPGHRCSCGLYASRELARARSEAMLVCEDLLALAVDAHGAPGDRDAFLAEIGATIFVGVVVSWGEIEVHEEGFRAEKMRLVALAPLDVVCVGAHAPIQPVAARDPKSLGQLARRYHVPMLSDPSSLVSLGQEHGTAPPPGPTGYPTRQVNLGDAEDQLIILVCCAMLAAVASMGAGTLALTLGHWVVGAVLLGWWLVPCAIVLCIVDWRSRFKRWRARRRAARIARMRP